MPGKNSGKYKIKLDLTKHRVDLLKKANELLKSDVVYASPVGIIMKNTTSSMIYMNSRGCLIIVNY